MKKRLIFTPLDNGNLDGRGIEQEFTDLRELINYIDSLCRINSNHKPTYTIAIGGLTFIDKEVSNILDFLLTFHSKDDNIFVFEFATHQEAQRDHLQYLEENDLLND
jgi:hypothetical protein